MGLVPLIQVKGGGLQMLLVISCLAVTWLSKPANAVSVCGVKQENQALVYDCIGVGFYVENLDAKNITTVIVFPPKGRKPGRMMIGAHGVVPGVGAFGVRIGDTSSDITSLRGVASIKKGAMQSKNGMELTYNIRFRDGRRLGVWIKKGYVSSLMAAGRFRTPEGVTESSGVKQIEKAYGTPDSVQEWLPHDRKPSYWGLSLLVTMPLSGALAGLVLRRIRKYSRYQSASAQFLYAFAAGVLFSTVGAIVGAALAALGSCERFSELEKIAHAIYRVSLVLVLAVPAGIGGGVTAGVFELLRKKCSSPMRCADVLLAILICGFFSGFFAIWLWPKTLVNFLSWLPIGLALDLFGVGLFLIDRGSSSNLVQGES